MIKIHRQPSYPPELIRDSAEARRPPNAPDIVAAEKKAASRPQRMHERKGKGEGGRSARRAALEGAADHPSTHRRAAHTPRACTSS